MDIFKLVGTIAINNENAKKNIKEITSLTEDAKEKISTGFGNIGKAAVTMGKLVGGVLVGSGAIGGALVALTDNTMEYRTAMGKLEAAFTTSGHTAEVATGIYTDLVSVIGDSDVAVEASNHLAKLASTQEELQAWTNICTGVFATFGDSLPIEGLTEAANETAKVGQVTGSLADALNWAGLSEDEFNKSLALCTTEQERQQLIMETLNGVYDEASQKYQEVNADVIAANEAQEKYTQAMATFGEKAQPIVNAVKNGLGDLLTAASKLVENINFEEVESAIDSAFSWLIDTAAPAVEEFFNFIVENKDYVVAAILAVATGFLAWNVVSIIQGVISAIKAWKLATEGMTLAQKLLNIVMNANPIGIVITLISALVAAFIYLWNNCEGFRVFCIEMWETIKTTISNAVTAIVEWFSNMSAEIAEKWEEIKEAVSEKVASILATVTSKFQEIKATITSKVNDAKASVKTSFENIKSTITSKVNDAKTKVQEVFENIKTSIETALNTAKEKVEKIWADICGVFSNAVGVGKKIVDDIKKGIENAWDGLKNWFKQIWDNLFGNLNADINVNRNDNTGGGNGHATGLNYVPYDEYPAILHKGEAVLNAVQAKAWRRGDVPSSVNQDAVSVLMMILEELQESNSRETVLKLNNREFGRAVRGAVSV